MKYIKQFLILTIVITGIFLTDAAAQTEAETHGLERKISKKLLRLPYYGVFDLISYQIEGDTVILSGKVARSRNKRDAENAIEDIEGVKQVINKIEILPLSPFDNSIRVRLLKTFVRSGGGVFRYLQEPNPSVRIIVEGGRVTLEGYVANRGDYNLLNILANGVTDVFNVQNNLLVEKKDR